MRCNICQGSDFIAMNARPAARCATCGSLERTRLMFMYVVRLGIGLDWRILHIAPEVGLHEAIAKRVRPGNCEAADLDPSRYSAIASCRKLDLCDLDREASGSYDLIIHSHVLEHTACNIAYTLFHIHRMLKADGTHMCVIPFLSGRYDECFQDIGDDERTRRFGQFDHVRRFGRDDIDRHLGALLRLPAEFDATKDFSAEELREANIPERDWKGFHAATVLSLRREDMKLLGTQA